MWGQSPFHFSCIICSKIRTHLSIMKRQALVGKKKKRRTNGAFSWIVLLTHLASTELLRLLSLIPGTQLNSYQANSPDQLLCVKFSFILTQVSVQLFVEIKATCCTCLHNIFRVDKCADLISGNMKFLVWNIKLVRHIDFTANTAWIVTTCGTETGYTVKT